MVAKHYFNENLRPNDLDAEVSELSLLLPAWQVGALEQLAQAEGLTVAQLLRRMVNKSLTQAPLHQPGYFYG